MTDGIRTETHHCAGRRSSPGLGVGLILLAAGALVTAACSLSTPVPPTLEITAPAATGSASSTETASPSQTPSSTGTPDGGQAVLLTPPAVPDSPVIAALRSDIDLVIRQIDMVDARSGWALGGELDGDDHVLVTADGGLTWSDRSPPQYRPTEAGRLAAAGFFASADQGWVVYFDASRSDPGGGPAKALQVWRTDDGGVSWSSSSLVGVEFIGADGFPPYLQFVTSGHGWLMTRVGGVGMHRYPVYLLHSDDQGETWRALEDPYRGFYLQSCTKSGMAFGDSLSGIVSISGCPVEGPQIERTSDGGRTWETLFLPAPADEPDLFEGSFCSIVHPATWVTADHALLAAECTRPDGPQDREINLLFSSHDGGQSWESLPYPGGTVVSTDADNMLALAQDIYRSDDGGASWTHVKHVTWDGQYDFVDSDQGWAVARSETELALVATSDGGQTWDLIEARLADSDQ